MSSHIQKFDANVCEELGFYVYRLIDPVDGKTFYVGKGTGNRLFAHVAEASNDPDAEAHKLRRIREIEDQGREVEHVIHRSGLTDKEACEVEAALIEAYEELSNLQAGRHSDDRGVMSVRDVLTRYATAPAKITEPVVFFKINRQWKRNLSPEALYERTRGYWSCNPDRHKGVKYAMAVALGVIREVYKIESWEKVDVSDEKVSVHREARKSRPRTTLRWAFTGTPALELQHYVGQSIYGTAERGSQNPFGWLNC